MPAFAIIFLLFVFHLSSSHLGLVFPVFSENQTRKAMDFLRLANYFYYLFNSMDLNKTRKSASVVLILGLGLIYLTLKNCFSLGFKKSFVWIH